MKKFFTKKEIYAGSFILLIFTFISLLFKPIFLVLAGFILGAFFIKTFGSIEVKSFSENNDITSDIKSNDTIEFEVNTLREKLTTFFSSNFISEKAKVSAEQVVRIDEKKNTFQNILIQKMSPNEISYSRYMGTINEVSNIVIDNLKYLITKFDAVQDIDLEFIENRLEDIKQMNVMSTETVNELDSLRERRSLCKKCLYEIDEIISSNSKLITGIDELSTKLTNMKDINAKSSLEIDYAISEISTLSKRLKLFIEKS